MTNNINRDALLRHLIFLAAWDKAEAWAASKRYAAMYEGWNDLPKLLTHAMKAKNEIPQH